MPCGEQTRVLLPFLRPLVADTQALAILPHTVAFEQLYGVRCELEDTPRSAVLGFVYEYAFLRQIERGALYVQQRQVKVNIVPLQPAEFTTAQAGMQQQCNHGAVYDRLIVQQVEQVRRLYFVQIMRFTVLDFRRVYTQTGIVIDQLPLYRR